jgi:hypothetical protein
MDPGRIGQLPLFAVWTLVGAGAALGAVSLGVLVLVPVLVVSYVLLGKQGLRRSAFGFVSGVGLLLLVVAYIQRDGSGLNPLPWLAVGLLLVGGGLVAFATPRATADRRRRRR